MHQVYLAILEKEISENEIFYVASELLQEDFIKGDEVEEGYAITDSLGDYLVIGGRYYNILITEEESEKARKEEKEIERLIVSKKRYGNDVMNKTYASMTAENEMCRKYACRRIDKNIYDKICHVKKQYSDLTFLDYVHEKITDKTPSFKSIKGHWAVIVDVHS